MKLSEMSLTGYHVSPDVGGSKRFSKQSKQSLLNPKVVDKLRFVLDRGKYDVIVIADPSAYLSGELSSTTGRTAGENAYDIDMPSRGPVTLPDEYYERAGIDPRKARKAITLILTFDNAADQHHLSPWIILHQLGEVVVDGGISDVWSDVYSKFEQYLKKTPLARGQKRNVEVYGGEEYKDSFSHLFKMRSAREFIHGGFDNFDTGAELVAEFLWHGGNIRVNYPDWIDRSIVDAIKTELEASIADRLSKMIGKAYNNDTLGDESYGTYS